ncbi:MAG: helix-turn-helix domain-containing protein [Roseburia sp.]|nr:helix-turn-helix domain-containing protein [Roseburia sp.]
MKKDDSIFRSLAMIEERLQERLTVEDLASGIHLSKYHYQRMFRETVGDSVMRYVTGRRMSLAAEELAEKDASVLAIALKYGYDSHEGFTRGFRAYMGVTPTEYRRYHRSIASPAMWKERGIMLYSNITDGMLRELNGLIVRAKETVAYTRKCGECAPVAVEAYKPFRDFIADRADAIAEKLTRTLERITAIAQRPDEISSRFMIIAAIEDAVFWTDFTVFQAGLMISRARPEHRGEFAPIYDRYRELSQEARVKSEKIVELFNELARMIFRDMRENAQSRVQSAVEAGRAVVAEVLPEAGEAAYIAEAIEEIADTLSAAPLEEITDSLLKEKIFRLDIIASAAEMDVLRAPETGKLLKGIAEFRERLEEAAAFFGSLSEDLAPAIAERTTGKMYRDIAFQTSILLFLLKGELQKLGRRYLQEEQEAAFGAVCDRLSEAIECAEHAETAAAGEDVSGKLWAAYQSVMMEAENLGEYGEPLRYIAEEIRRLIP